MKKEIRQITCPATRTVYIADDGHEFDSESECAKHERRLSFEALFDKIQMCRELDQVPPVGLSWINSENVEFYWFFVASKDDFDLINQTCDFRLPDEDFKSFENRWVCISIEFDGEIFRCRLRAEIARYRMADRSFGKDLMP